MKQTIIRDNNEITLIDLLAIIWRRKWIIIGICSISCIFIVVFALISISLPPEKSPLPNEYTPQAIMLINDTDSPGGALSNLLSSSSLGSLASLAGISSGSSMTYSGLAIYICQMSSFLDVIIDEFDLVKRYKVEKNIRSVTRDNLKERLVASYDDTSGIFSLKYTDIDPAYAQAIINFSAKLLEKRFSEIGIDKKSLEKINIEKNLSNTLNEIKRLESESQNLARNLGAIGRTPDGTSYIFEASRLDMELEAQKNVYTELKTQYELLKVRLASETPIFQVLEYAEVPDRKSGPSRGLLCVLVAITAFCFSLLLTFLLQFVESIKNDPDAAVKFSSTKKAVHHE